MAVEHRKSGTITNRDAQPAVFSNPAAMQGMLRGFVGVVAVTNADSIGSTYRLGQVPSNALVRSLKLYCPAITTAVADVGLYRTTRDGGEVVDADFFASAQALTSALNGLDVTHESGEFGIDDGEKPIWEALGLPSDPSLIYDVTATLTAAAGATQPLKATMEYAI